MALSRQLAAQAVGEMDVGLDGALLKGVEAYRAAPTFEARQALLAVLFYSPHLRRFVTGPPHRWLTAALSRNGRTIVALDADTGNVLIQTAGEKSLETVAEVNGRRRVKSVAVSAAGNSFATGEPRQVVIRNVGLGRLRARLAPGWRPAVPRS